MRPPVYSYEYSYRNAPELLPAFLAHFVPVRVQYEYSFQIYFCLRWMGNSSSLGIVPGCVMLI